MIFKKILNSNRVFIAFVLIFTIILGIALYIRGGKDLKVAIYGAQQTLHRDSPYKNPEPPDTRVLFRYAPGFAIMMYPFLLTSKPYKSIDGSLQIDNIEPSLFTWYFLKLLMLFLSGLIMLKIIPAVSRQISIRNLKISFLMATPFIACELANSQNKIPALFFMLLALWMFEENRLFLSALCFSLSLTVYIPLSFFGLYFVIRNKRFIYSFILAAVIVFLVLPSLVFGVNFNLFLLKDWFVRNIMPFSLTNTFTTYIELRKSNQALPGAVGRILACGYTDNFKYLISPFIINKIIKISSLIIVIISCLSVLRKPKVELRGLSYAVFFILALILPQYCINYTWAWAFLFYFAIFNYMSFPICSSKEKKILALLVIIIFIGSISTSFKICSQISILFWSTMVMWLGLTSILLRRIFIREEICLEKK